MKIPRESGKEEKIAGFGFTSSDDNIKNYKENVFILRDQTWNSSDIYMKDYQMNGLIQL